MQSGMLTLYIFLLGRRNGGRKCKNKWHKSRHTVGTVRSVCCGCVTGSCWLFQPNHCGSLGLLVSTCLWFIQKKIASDCKYALLILIAGSVFILGEGWLIYRANPIVPEDIHYYFFYFRDGAQAYVFLFHLSNKSEKSFISGVMVWRAGNGQQHWDKKWRQQLVRMCAVPICSADISVVEVQKFLCLVGSFPTYWSLPPMQMLSSEISASAYHDKALRRDEWDR